MPGRDDAATSQNNNRRQLQGLPVLRRNAAGIDLGSERHWVCAATLDGSGREIASFGATTPELLRLAEWLKARQVESVAMESTGVYWIAPHEVLEAQGSRCCWWIHGNWRGCQGGTRKPIRPIASGFSGCTVAACCGVRSGRRKLCACCAPWCGIRRTWWGREETGCGECKRAWTR